MIKLYEMYLIDYTSEMVNLDKIETVKERPGFVELHMTSGKKLSVLEQSFYIAVEHSGSLYLKTSTKEEEEDKEDVKFEDLPDVDIEDLG